MSPIKSNENIQIQTDLNETQKQNNSPVLVCEQVSVEIRQHCHHPRIEGVNARARNKLYLACVVCFVLMVIEFTGGIISNSLAVTLDAAHLCTDLVSFLIALLAIWIAGRPATQRFNFGWYRAEIIGALFSICLIWFMTGSLCYLAVKRILSGSFDIDPVIMMITSGIAAACNFIVGLMLYADLEKLNIWFHLKKTSIVRMKRRSRVLAQHTVNTQARTITNNCVCPVKDESIQTTPSLQYMYIKDKKNRNLPVQTAIINALGDMLQSVGVFLAGITIYYKPNWIMIDPILTFVFAFIVLIATLCIIGQAVMVLMEATPTYLDYDEIKKVFESIKGVKNVHNLRVWALNLDKVACLVHLEIEENVNPTDILHQANHTIHQHYNFFETTIQIE